MRVGDQPAAGEGTFFLNQLGAELATTGAHRPGEPLRLRGEVFQLRSGATATERDGVAAQFRLRVVDADGAADRPALRPVHGRRGRHRRRDPAGLRHRRAEAHRGPRTGARPCGSRCSAPASRTTARSAAASGPPPTASPPAPPPSPPRPDEPVLENSFVSSKGWVKPGETYPFTVRVRNYTDAPFDGPHRHRQRAGRDDAAQRAQLHRRRSRRGRRRPRARGQGRHARAGPADRLEGPLQHRHARRRRRSPATARR